MSGSTSERGRFAWWVIPVSVTAAYVVFGGLWIVLTDQRAAAAAPGVAALTRLQTIKGWVYVLITAAGLFLLACMASRSVRCASQQALVAQERTLAQVNLLNRVSQAMIAAVTLEDLLQAALLPLSDRDICMAGLFSMENNPDGSPQQIELHAVVAPEGAPRLPVGSVFRAAEFEIGRFAARSNREIYAIPDVEAGDTLVDGPLRRVLGQIGQRAAVLILLGLPGQRRTAVLGLAWPHPRTLSAEERQLYTLIAPQLAALVENRRLLVQMGEQAAFRATLLDNLPVGLLATDNAGIVIEANPAFERMSGYTRVELLGASITRLFPPNVGIGAVPSEAHQEDERFAPFEGAIVHKDGRHVPARMSLSVLKDAQGRKAGILGSVEDLTAARQTEQALRESRQMLQLVMDNIPQTIFWKDRRSVYLGCNRVFADDAGLPSPEAVVGLTDYDLPWERDQAEFYRKVDAEVMQSGQPRYDVIEPQRQASGKQAWLRTNKVPLRDAEGRVFGVMGMYEDITERIQAEQAERDQRALVEALREVATVLSSTLDLDEVLEHILRSAGRVVLHDACNIMLVENRMARLVRSQGYDRYGGDAAMTAINFDVDSTPNLRQMAADGQPMIIADTATYEGWHDLPTSRWIRSWAGAPIRFGGELIGFINVDAATPGFFTGEHASRLQAFADQAAAAIKNANLYASERRQLRLAQTLQEVGTLLTAEMGLEELFERIFDLLARVVDYTSVSVQLLNEEGRLSMMAGRGFPDSVRAEAIADDVFMHTSRERWANNDVLVIPDTHHDTRWLEYPGHEYMCSWVGAALRIKGRLIGVLNVDSERPNAYNEETGRTVLAFASQAAIAIENARLYAESQDRNRRLEALNRITRIGTTTLDLDELLRTLADTAAEIIGGDACYLTCWDAEKQLTYPAAAYGSMRETYAQEVPAPDEVTLTASVFKLGRSLVVEDVFNTPYLSRSIAERYPTRSMLAVPLRAGDQFLGAMLIGFNETHHFTEAEVEWAEQAAELIALAIARAEAYTELERRVAARTAELQAANTRLLELSQMKDEFVSNVSHELRTPIASIKLYHHLLAARPERQAVYLERLARETIRLESIIEDLLYLSRIDQGQFQLRAAPVEVNQLARQYTVDRAPLAQQRGLALDFVPAADLPDVQGDPAALGQALSVLLTNALNYTPAGGEIRVSTAVSECDGRPWVTLAVSNNGPVIPPEELPRIFERFFRGVHGRESGTPGTGLGLPIASNIIAQHGGRIEVESPCDGERGACFTIWLPAAQSRSGP